MKYEVQYFQDGKFPIKFHTDRIFAEGNKHHTHKNIKNNFPNEIPMHWHEGLEIWRIVTGNPTVILDTEPLSAKEGDIVVINTSRLHTIKVTESECVYEVLGIDDVFCKEFGFDLENIFFQNVISDGDLSLMFDKISDEFYSSFKFYEAVILGVCMEMLGNLSRNYRTEKRITDASLLKRTGIIRQMTRYISNNFSSQDILSQLSTHLNYSTSYLTHLFLESVGTSIKEYQMCIKFNNAKKMLSMESLSVFEVSKLCGYSTSSAFSTAFRKRVGITPAEYIRKNKTNNI